MGKAITALLNTITLDNIGNNLYRGNSLDIGLPQVFGGQIIAQALYAARQTVHEDRYAHSLHAYFLRPGDCKKAIDYEVETLRDGMSFSNRRVIAWQNDQPIFQLMTSFQFPETGLEHDSVMPQTTAPEQLQNEEQLTNAIAHLLPPELKKINSKERPIEIRPITPVNPFKGTKLPPCNYFWFKANGNISEDLNLHHYLLSYVSDMYFLPTALQPHGIGFLEPGIQVASIDHTIHFHRPFSINDWLLYAIETPVASSTRGFVKGQIFNQQGVLVASTSQEGLMRLY